jgi:hypothetical protein
MSHKKNRRRQCVAETGLEAIETGFHVSPSQARLAFDIVVYRQDIKHCQGKDTDIAGHQGQPLPSLPIR